MSVFQSIIFEGISFFYETFEESPSFTSFMTSSFVIWLKLKTDPLLGFSFIIKMLGWLQYFVIAFKLKAMDL